MKSLWLVSVIVLALCAQARADEQWDQASGIVQIVKAASAQEEQSASVAKATSPFSGVPVGDDSVSLSLVSPLDAKDFRFEMVLNNTKDRVGAEVSVCGVTGSTMGGKANARVMTCQPLLFTFPGLRYDAGTKRVLLGDEVVARGGGFWHDGLELADGFRPDYTIEQRQVDKGFDRITEFYVGVRIVRVPAK